MKEIINKYKFNIFIYTIIYLVIFIIIKLILNACGMEFMHCVYIFSICITILGFVAGMVQAMIRANDKSTKICIAICLACITFFLAIFGAFYIAFLPPEHIVEEHALKKDKKQMVGYVRAFLSTRVDYYDYYNILVRGKYRLIEDDYGKGGFDPFEEKLGYKHEVLETRLYNKEGKIIYTHNNIKQNVTIIDSDNNILNGNTNYESDIKDYDSNKLPSNVPKEDILYEKDINGTKKIRVAYLESILAQRSIVRIEKTEDSGKTWLSVHDSYENYIQIHNGAEFTFIDENIGFINDPGLAGTNGENGGLMLTTNGGKTFKSVNIIHPRNIEERNLFVKGVPYEEDGKLKVKIYTINHNKDPKKTYYEFISKDKGRSWECNKIIK